MTLINLIRCIEKLLAQLLKHTDSMEYKKAHFDLDDVQTKVNLVRQHIDLVQMVSSETPFGADEDSGGP